MAKANTAPELRLSQRDMNVLRAVAEGQQVTTSQIASLLFPSTKKASARLKQLTDAGFLRSSRKTWTFAKSSIENFYGLAKNGREALRAVDGRLVAAQAKPVANISHLACTNQLRVLLTCETIGTGYLDLHFLASWQMSMVPKAYGDPITGKGLGKNLSSSIKPDAAFTLRSHGGTSLLFFAEIDMASEPITRCGSGSSLLGKIERYASYFDSGEYRRDGEQLFGHRFRGFRMLLLTTKDSRLQQLRAQVDRFGDTHFVWGSTFKRIESASILGSPWQVVAPDDDGSYRCICQPYHSPTWTVGEEKAP